MTISRVIRGHLFTGRLKDECHLTYTTQSNMQLEKIETQYYLILAVTKQSFLCFFFFLSRTLAGGGNVTGHTNFSLHGYFFG